jgi:TRAP-type mannitol/chloroaromatic compound transport system permease small subunit
VNNIFYVILFIVLGIALLKKYDSIKYKSGINSSITVFGTRVDVKSMKHIGIAFLILGGIGMISVVAETSEKTKKS